MGFSTLRLVSRPLNCTFNTFQRCSPPTSRITIPVCLGTGRLSFSTTSSLQKRAQKAVKDPRITAIRYHLNHPLTPRPLHFSRSRYLRHWTIHRAWLLFLRKRRWAQERCLERQYESMRAACEHLRLLDNDGNRVPETEGGGQGPDSGQLGVRGREVGRLYRGAMLKRGVWGNVPIEYARVQTDSPAREGWNHRWTR